MKETKDTVDFTNVEYYLEMHEVIKKSLVFILLLLICKNVFQMCFLICKNVQN